MHHDREGVKLIKSNLPFPKLVSVFLLNHIEIIKNNLNNHIQFPS